MLKTSWVLSNFAFSFATSKHCSLGLLKMYSVVEVQSRMKNHERRENYHFYGEIALWGNIIPKSV